MNQKLISQGAEAKIFLINNKVIKDRIKKSYRLKEIDVKLRTQRTKRETKILEKAYKLIPSPLPEKSENKTKIIMPYIKGKKLSEYLDNLKNQKNICIQIGENLAKIHDAGLIHGDLTTSNMILDKNNTLWFIDFGLSYHSTKKEDKAVDLHLIKQALEAKHFNNWQILYKHILKGYKKSEHYKKVLTQLKKVESRGRYKHKH